MDQKHEVEKVVVGKQLLISPDGSLYVQCYNFLFSLLFPFPQSTICFLSCYSVIEDASQVLSLLCVVDS